MRIGETGRAMHEQIEEHGRDIRDIRLSRTQTSTVSEHTNAIRSGIIHNGTGLGLVIETLTGTLEELKKLC